MAIVRLHAGEGAWDGDLQHAASENVVFIALQAVHRWTPAIESFGIATDPARKCMESSPRRTPGSESEPSPNNRNDPFAGSTVNRGRVKKFSQKGRRDVLLRC